MAVMEEGHVMDLPHPGAVVCIGAREWTEFRYQIRVVGACPYKTPSAPMEPEACCHVHALCLVCTYSRRAVQAMGRRPGPHFCVC
jgi:hypothetical protein